ncbi:MarR family winged helix-turn-helix transcriptional regulator [Homoserinibacter sp. YIM 151385]|uniref:MarR family winged helix-turn-helix transcriptional regulator n=1 Tax=Homoserinibacter sp. YIM 151385 TaxID=2985506 RepID=UPI0022F09195|nr:MarR family transcriptional regulator [Homoserinibacter sp. YIM 151385]WBU38798.1 MarR family transcriptional regulator [Homoserinibacter sp. YIM 151385]
MPNKQADPNHESAGAWAKKYHLATRQVMESVLRPHDLGPTQWYVLYQLALVGATPQRELVRILEVERATLSGVVAALTRKGLVEQRPDPSDARQRVLHLTSQGRVLWGELPDPIELILRTAFAEVSDADLATTTRVLRTGTARLHELLTKGTPA